MITSAKTSRNFSSSFLTSNTPAAARVRVSERLNHNWIERKFEISFFPLERRWHIDVWNSSCVCLWSLPFFIRFNGNLVFSYLRATHTSSERQREVHANPCVHYVTIIEREWKRARAQVKVYHGKLRWNSYLNKLRRTNKHKSTQNISILWLLLLRTVKRHTKWKSGTWELLMSCSTYERCLCVRLFCGQ